MYNQLWLKLMIEQKIHRYCLFISYTIFPCNLYIAVVCNSLSQRSKTYCIYSKTPNSIKYTKLLFSPYYCNTDVNMDQH